MDRLSVVKSAAVAAPLTLCLAACPSQTPGDAKSYGSASRVEAVTAKPPATVSVDDFCDTRRAPATLRFPPLGEDGEAPSNTAAMWINAWASWCAPCLEEFPTLAKFEKRLAQDGVNMRFIYLSLDTEAAPLDRLRAREPNTPTTLRIRDEQALDPWLASLGLRASTMLPFHVFTRTGGNVSCIRTGTVSNRHYATIKKLLRPAPPA
ncbi:MAG: hypothetical protein V3V08_02480 [Nannocystaceae bacterium]